MNGDFIYKPLNEKVSSEPVLGLFDKSRRKSSRSKADLFELLLTQELNKRYQLPYKDLENKIKKIIKQITIFKDGLIRIDEQKKRVNLLLQPLIKELNKFIETSGRPIEITWIGRKWQTNKPLSDINIKFLSGKNIGISTKSTRSGKGTQKNIGFKELKKYLGLDIDKELLDMKKKIILKVSFQNKELNLIAKKGITFIRKNKYKFPIIQKIGKEYGVLIQYLAVKESVNFFNKLSSNKKEDFLNFIFGFKDGELLLNAIVSGKQVNIYWNKNLTKLIGDNLEAINEGERGYCIASNGKKIVRIQVNFTNGIGISAFCERAFL